MPLHSDNKHPLDGIAVGVEFEGEKYYFKPKPYITVYDLAIITGFLLLADREQTAEVFGTLHPSQREHFERKEDDG